MEFTFEISGQKQLRKTVPATSYGKFGNSWWPFFHNEVNGCLDEGHAIVCTITFTRSSTILVAMRSAGCFNTCMNFQLTRAQATDLRLLCFFFIFGYNPRCEWTNSGRGAVSLASTSNGYRLDEFLWQPHRTLAQFGDWQRRRSRLNGVVSKKIDMQQLSARVAWACISIKEC